MVTPRRFEEELFLLVIKLQALAKNYLKKDGISILVRLLPYHNQFDTADVFNSTILFTTNNLDYSQILIHMQIITHNLICSDCKLRCSGFQGEFRLALSITPHFIQSLTYEFYFLDL